MFYTLAALNLAISELDRSVGYQVAKSPYEQLDKPALKALPPYRYEYVDICRAKIGPYYHVLYGKHAYSVPHALVGSHINIEVGTRLVRLYHRGTLVAQHPRAQQQSGFTTQAEHMPESHRQQRWSPDRLLSWGERIGSAPRAVVAWHLHHRPPGKGLPDQSGAAQSQPRIWRCPTGECLPAGAVTGATMAAGDPESADEPPEPAERRSAE